MSSKGEQADQPIVILGAGINGAALARELVLNRQSVWLVDRADIGSGTTAYSSRLIHGGLRYLEYGDFDLVKESLSERTRLLQLAPNFVRPLRLYIPISRRWGGLLSSTLKFFKLDRGREATTARGMTWVRMGLWLYDNYARDPKLPRHSSARTGASSDQPLIDGAKYPWVCSYTDGQILSPERFTLALVQDAQRLAAEQGTEFKVFTYHAPQMLADRVELFPVNPTAPFDEARIGATPTAATQPCLIVNATGAWVDQTLNSLRVKQRTLLSGTKGTHLFTRSARLRQALRGNGIYGEADDGRPVFILPIGAGVMVGTTDERFTGPPETAVASEQELNYLMGLVNTIVPTAQLTREQIDWHYAGVRPLPRVEARTTGAITRRHFLVESKGCAVPLYSIVGGKLTTCRSLAEEAARQILTCLGKTISQTSRERPLPGSENYPDSPAELETRFIRLAAKSRLTRDTVAAVWSLCGTDSESALSMAAGDDAALVVDTLLPRGVVRRIIRQEFVRTLDDLVERRLMLLFGTGFSRLTLSELAEILISEHCPQVDSAQHAVECALRRLESHFGFKL